MRMLRLGLPFLALATLASGAYVGLHVAPPDLMMGNVQRIMYVHVPCMWMALLLLTVNFFCSVLYLFKPSWGLDALAESTCEVGVVVATIGVVLGSIWARPTWGVWWDWDPRLTTVAILLVAYAGYLALRKFIEDPERRAVWSAVVAIIAAVDVPIVYYSVRWWRSLHQMQSSPQTVHSHMMVLALRWNAFAMLFVTVAFVWNRYRIARAARSREVALPPALEPVPSGAHP